jgi:hypothetical protein
VSTCISLWLAKERSIGEKGGLVVMLNPTEEPDRKDVKLEFLNSYPPPALFLFFSSPALRGANDDISFMAFGTPFKIFGFEVPGVSDIKYAPPPSNPSLIV